MFLFVLKTGDLEVKTNGSTYEPRSGECELGIPILGVFST